MTMQQEIRQRILQSNAPKMPPETSFHALVPAPRKNSQTWMTVVLGFCVLALSIATAWVFFQKNDFRFKKMAAPVKPVETVVQPKVQQPDHRRDIADLDRRVKELESGLEVWSHRIWLLGLAHNENVSHLRSIQQHQGYADPGYIYFDEKWKLNKTPQTLEFTEEQKKILRERDLK